MSVTIQQASQQIQDEVSAALQALGVDEQKIGQGLQQFMQDIQPEVQEALSTGDLQALSFIRDRVAGKVGMTALAASDTTAQVATSTVMTVLSMLIKIGIGAIT